MPRPATIPADLPPLPATYLELFIACCRGMNYCPRHYYHHLLTLSTFSHILPAAGHDILSLIKAPPSLPPSLLSTLSSSPGNQARKLWAGGQAGRRQAIVVVTGGVLVFSIPLLYTSITCQLMVFGSSLPYRLSYLNSFFLCMCDLGRRTISCTYVCLYS